MYQLPNFFDPFWLVSGTLILFGIIMGRYVLVAGIFYLVFYIFFPQYWESRKINSTPYKKTQFRKELKWSLATALIFATVTAISVGLWQQGLIRVYTKFNQFAVWWIPVSLLIAVVLHETYYYWLHRWMHHPKIFPIVHKIHHASHITSPWTAFSFHPLEGLLQAIFLPLLLMVLPMHIYVLLFMLTFMTLSSVVNHLDIEVYPRQFQQHWLGKWLIGATHHSLHHKQFKYNFGLYFTFWDKWKKTESPSFRNLFELKTGKLPKPGLEIRKPV